MQPFVGTETELAPASQAPQTDSAPNDRQADVRNLVIIAGGFLLLLLIIPPQHEYPIIDDWIYAGSVRDMLNTGRFIMPDMSQANLVGQTLWGALWARLFGFSFTTLTYSTLAMALACLLAFYGVARLLKVPPRGALLGTALLALNPIFLHLSYSFMTDVPFLALTLISCYCYVRGLGSGIRGQYFSSGAFPLSTDPRSLNLDPWLLLGGLFAGWAFLIRQFAVLVPAAFFLYLAVEGLWQRPRRLLWREMLSVVALPLLVFGVWYVWIRTPLTPTSVAAASRSSLFILKEPWLRVSLLRSFTIMPLTALFAWSAVKIPRSRWWLVLALAALLAWAVYAVDLPTETWLAMPEPPFTAQLGPLSLDLPQEPFSFGGIGNIVRVDGIDFFEYRQQAIWSPEAWRAVWLLGAALAVLLLAKMASALYDGVRDMRRGQPLTPDLPVYLVGILTFVISMALPGDLFDRYVLAFLPFLLLFVVRGSGQWGMSGSGRPAWTYSIAALLMLGTFTLLAKADQVDHDNARWQAAQWFSAGVGAVHMGFDWDRWMGQTSDVRQVTDIPIDGFRTERQFPYTCRLCGFTTRYVLAQSRADQPPVP